jgi:hypothetical protein
VDTTLLAVLCFLMALVLGYFFGRTAGIGSRDSRDRETRP